MYTGALVLFMYLCVVTILINVDRYWKMLNREKGNIEPKVSERSLDELHRLVTSYRKQSRIVSSVLVVLIFFVFTQIGIQLVTDRYTNRAITHYRQLLAITAPFRDEADTKRREALFAQIQYRADYERIINDLEDVAGKHSLRIPAFDIW